MPKIPNSRPDGFVCDPSLPMKALEYRQAHDLVSKEKLGTINVTAWLYKNHLGATNVQVNANVTMAEIRAEFGPPPTRDADFGIHSEAFAAEFFRRNPKFSVLQIFTERIPCKNCAELLKNFFPGRPWFYYYNRSSFINDDYKVIMQAGEALWHCYFG